MAGALLIRPVMPFDAPPPASLAGLPVLVLGGQRDPYRRMGTAVGPYLREQGAMVSEHWLPAGHEMTDGDLHLISDWLQSWQPRNPTKRNDHMATPELRKNEGEQRYEVLVDGETAGFVTYSTDGGNVTLAHTEVDDAYEGQGLGSELARFALDDIRDSGQRVVPQCSFINSYIRRHPDYQGLVAANSAQ